MLTWMAGSIVELLDRADLGYFEKKQEDWDNTKTLPEDLIGVLCITMTRERILFYPQSPHVQKL